MTVVASIEKDFVCSVLRCLNEEVTMSVGPESRDVVVYQLLYVYIK